MCRHTQAMLEAAIEAARDWGYKWPRRWSAKHAGITYSSNSNSPQLIAQYNTHRAAIAARIPKRPAL